MARDGDILFSIITPTAGNRPNALNNAVQSVERAARFAGLERNQVEILVGFDGVRGTAPRCAYPVRVYSLPGDRNRGHGVRDILIKLADGGKLVFLDDDNVLKPCALSRYLRHLDAEMVVARVDAQLTLDQPWLPVLDDGPLVRPGNMNLLSLCLSRALVADRCGGWRHHDKPDACRCNIADWYRTARSVTVIEEVVGILDAGRSLDRAALSSRQKALLDELVARRVTPPATALSALRTDSMRA
ncbi:glycosyltransferase [Pseudodesulfovibrio thermohalotolerans]|uniref:glycosyltransferase family 2 protein n=1 Tax=Pseudodesulfovibrio thermohalotolerans TaxID=2880651 RepID=UPI00244107CC|nr:glycosyltransferase [Pseudodesulfovibrio thermohalotolerans]WFS62026.1 glycosyltransferase [Pseudodesulfovibrio thermohalotolerans]